jgi:hypothetical protein
MLAKGSGDDNEGKGLTPVAHGLHGNELPVEHAHAIVAEELAVGTADFVERKCSPRGRLGEALFDVVGVGVVGVSGSPVKRGGRPVSMLEEDRDGIVPSVVTVIQGLEEDVNNGVDDSFGSSEREARV